MAKKDDAIYMMPKKQCRYCWGRGWLRKTIGEIKYVTPCHCVKALVREWPDADKIVTQKVMATH